MQTVLVAFLREHWIPNPSGRAVGIELPVAVRRSAGLRDLLTWLSSRGVRSANTIASEVEFELSLGLKMTSM